MWQMAEILWFLRLFSTSEKSSWLEAKQGQFPRFSKVSSRDKTNAFAIVDSFCCALTTLKTKSNEKDVVEPLLSTCQSRLFSKTLFFPNEIDVLIKMKTSTMTRDDFGKLKRQQLLMLALDSNIVLGLIIQYDQDVGAIAKWFVRLDTSLRPRRPREAASNDVNLGHRNIFKRESNKLGSLTLWVGGASYVKFSLPLFC